MSPLMYDATRYTHDASPLCAYKFTGKERDAESGLDNFDFRYYGSSLGRFMKPDDPLLWWDRSDPQSLNLYSYAENNPVGSTDDGHSVTICDTNGHCNTVSDDDYSAAQQADKNNIAPSLSNLANSSTGTGAITNSSGGVVGTVQWTPDNPGIQTLGLAGQMAAPGVNFAAQGLRMFGYAFAAPVMVAAECLAGAPSCTKGNVAMAILPEVGALREGSLLLKEGAAFGKGAEILQKAVASSRPPKTSRVYRALSQCTEAPESKRYPMALKQFFTRAREAPGQQP
jgi:RHS repeat-associated protein